MLGCERLSKVVIEHLIKGFSCYVEEPYVVLATPFFYSDGDTIELFLEQTGNSIRISDMGETSRRLSTFGFNWNTNVARSLFSQILETTNTSSNRGMIYILVIDGEDLGAKVMDLIHAIQQIDNLVFTMKKYVPKTFRDEVENYLRKEGFEPELNYPIAGKSGTVWRVHFYINHGSNILAKALSTPSKGGEKYQVSTTFTAYEDIKKLHPSIKRSVIIDDSMFPWDAENVQLIQQVVDCEIGYWSQKEVFSSNIHQLVKSSINE